MPHHGAGAQEQLPPRIPSTYSSHGTGPAPAAGVPDWPLHSADASSTVDFSGRFFQAGVTTPCLSKALKVLSAFQGALGPPYSVTSAKVLPLSGTPTTKGLLAPTAYEHSNPDYVLYRKQPVSHVSTHTRRHTHTHAHIHTPFAHL